MIAAKTSALRLCLLAFLCVLSACGGLGRLEKTPADDETASVSAGAPPAVPGSGHDLPAVKVGILLPLSGSHAALGQAMLQSAQMALFSAGYARFELIPRDTGESPETARQAAQSVVDDGAKLILGPVFAADVAATKPVARAANVSMIAFSNDWKLAGEGTFIMGFTPFDQVGRITRYAASRNIKSVAVLAPSGEYGQAVGAAFTTIAPRYGINVPAKTSFPASGAGIDSAIRGFVPAAAGAQAVLLPAGGQLASAASGKLSAGGLPPSKLKRLGTALLEDGAASAYDPNLDGAWFAAPPPAMRDRFEQRYAAAYGTRPPRLATLAYDATALAVALARRGFDSSRNAPAYDRGSISDPNGFSGVDGIFRFRPEGTAERGLAILEFQNGRTVVIDEAPKTFQPGVR